MAEDITEGTIATEGQPASGTSDETIQTGPIGGNGKPEGTGQTTASGTAHEDSFFDPKELAPELVPAYKQMQRAFSKKMESVRDQRSKIDAYEAFNKDPLSQIQTIASQMGYKLTRADAEMMAEHSEGGGYEPKTWEEVFDRAKQEVMRELSPVFTELQATKKQNVEKMLDESCPDWREYEDEMTKMLREHPTLAKDPVKLYMLAIPSDVLQTRATQAALKKLQAKTDSSKIGGTSSTKQQGASLPDKPLSFNDAVAYAKAKLAEQGIKAPH